MQPSYIGIREAKMHLSKYLKAVREGREVIITDRGRPVGRIVPIQNSDLPITSRLRQMEEQGLIQSIAGKAQKKIPPLIPVSNDIHQRFLQEDRDSG